MTIRAALDDAAARLGAAGVASARLEAELLLEHVAGTPRLRLLVSGSDPLPASTLERFGDLVGRRCTRVPLQHLTGWTSFLGHRIECGPGALVPRPETEQLALLAIGCLHAPGSPAAPRILEIGTGTGCIAVALAAAFPDASVTTVELSPAAAALARRNLASSGVATRVELVEGDAYAVVPALGRRFDLIVTNPPYIASGEIASLDPEVRVHDPWPALDGGEDGLGHYRRLAREARGWLEPGGGLAAEFGDGQAPAIASLFAASGWDSIRVEKDLSGRERVLIVRAPPGPRP